MGLGKQPLQMGFCQYIDVSPNVCSACVALSVIKTLYCAIEMLLMRFVIRAIIVSAKSCFALRGLLSSFLSQRDGSLSTFLALSAPFFLAFFVELPTVLLTASAEKHHSLLTTTSNLRRGPYLSA